jgi:ligand-binding SRPBCC domain-containing protein
MFRIEKDQQRRGGYVLHAESFVRRPLDEVFAFFSDALNLQRITPPSMRFKVVTPGPIVMARGLRIDYRLRVRGLPMRWRSEITTWEPGVRFVDEQRRGPYRYWIHEHRFHAKEGGTQMLDTVHYASPGGPLIHRWLVRPDLEKVFGFREESLKGLFA